MQTSLHTAPPHRSIQTHRLGRQVGVLRVEGVNAVTCGAMGVAALGASAILAA